MGSFCNGRKSKNVAANIIPELTALTQSIDALMILYFLSCSQNLITKNIKNVQGRNTPNAAIMAPSI